VDQSAQVYEYISQCNYDIVIFDVFEATGFIPIRCKRTGLGLERTLLVSWLRTCHEFQRNQVLETPDNFDPFMMKEQLDFAEKYCCENSDLVLSHTDTIVKWALEQEWNIDNRRVVPMADLKVGRSLGANRGELIVDDPMQDQEPLGSKESPLVSICVAHYNDGHNLSYLLKSIEQNDYNNFEVIVVDDGSTDKESLRIFESLASEYANDSWQFIMKGKNEGPGPTRNFAVSRASAEFIIFTDSDDLAASTMISDFVKGMLRSGVDCLTCSAVLFRGDCPVAEEAGFIGLSMPLGGCVELVFYPYFFGGTNFCVKKSVFEALSGFSDILGINEDCDFLARLVLAEFEMDVVPKGIYFYRQRSGSRYQITGSSSSMQTLRKKLLVIAGSRYEKLIHSLLLREISENERLRRSVWKLDRKVVKIVLKLSDVISEKHRLIVGNMLASIFRKLYGLRTNTGQFSKVWNLMIGKESKAGHELARAAKNRIDGSLFFVQTLSKLEFENQLTRFELPSNRPIFGFMGGLTEDNRPLGFLRVAYWMQMSEDNSFFIMAGDGELRKIVQTTATRYRLQNFRWIPFVERPEELYAILSGLVITSGSGRGLTEMFEALACGVPVFSTGVGEAKRLLEQYGSGLAVTHDPERKDFAECFKLWKDNLEIYKTAAMETAALIRRNFGV
jgi:glycosyltransferase involved in cell wall biosynthesis